MPHSELPYAEGEEILEVMSLDRGAGVRPVEGEEACLKTLRRVRL